MSKRIIITGATGLIGKKIAFELIKRGDEVTIFSRNAEKAKSIIPNAKDYVKWNYKTPAIWENHFENCDAVVHLAGTNLFAKRWSDNFKKEILESREVSTRNLVDVIGKSQNKPSVFISASGVGYYGDSGETLLNEESRAGNDFLANVCKVWESESQKVNEFGIRNVQIRTGLVLSPEDGALKQMLPAFKFFVGGPLGNGRQWASWIHIDDIVGIYIQAIDNIDLTGAVNAASPNPVQMNEFAKTLGKVMNRPALLPVAKLALKIVVGEAAEVVTASQRISVNKILENGYKFKVEYLEKALMDLLK